MISIFCSEFSKHTSCMFWCRNEHIFHKKSWKYVQKNYLISKEQLHETIDLKKVGTDWHTHTHTNRQKRRRIYLTNDVQSIVNSWLNCSRDVNAKEPKMFC